MHVAKEKRLPAKIEIGANEIPQAMEMQNGIKQSMTDNPLVALLIKYDMIDAKTTQATTPPNIPHQTPAFCPMPIPVQIATTGIIKHELHPLIPLAISTPLGLLLHKFSLFIVTEISVVIVLAFQETIILSHYFTYGLNHPIVIMIVCNNHFDVFTF